jgi:hypothetical protein
MPMTWTSASCSSAVNPLRSQVVANDPPHPWINATGEVVRVMDEPD